MAKCDCYHVESKRKYTFNHITGDPIGYDIDIGVCWGTKECDECSCGGDETKCDFYPEVRENGRKNKALKFGQWISVEDRLPEDSNDVLVYGDGCFSIGYKNRFNKKLVSYENTNMNITHWMSLPDAPKEVEHNAEQ